MSFASPIWLLGLIPWAGLVIWLLIGYREHAEVPFLHLWPTDAPRPRLKRSLRMPPAALICLLLAMLLAICGAAGPTLHDPSRGRRITIIVDRDVTMSARSAVAADRLRELVQEAKGPIVEALGLGPVDLIFVPDGSVQHSDRSDWLGPVGQVRVSSLQTADLLRQTVDEALRSNDDPVIVLSDQALEVSNQRLIHITPGSSIENIGLVRIAAREHPKLQVMATVRNDASRTQARLVVVSDGRQSDMPIELPPRGEEKNYFIDVQALASTASVELVTDDDLAADNRAWLVRRGAWPIIEPRGALPAELGRMVETYQKLRPPGDDSRRVAVATNLQQIDPAQPAAIVVGDPAAPPLPAGQELRIEDHPVAAVVDWADVASTARVAEPPLGNWRPVVAAGERMLIGVREQPARQVWVSVESEQWARSSDFVIFWTNVFDWLGQGPEGFVAEPMQQPGAQWVHSPELSGAPPQPLEPLPGIYRRSDGALRALNCTDIRLSPGSPGDWKSQLQRRWPRQAGGRRLDAASLVAALGCALLASLLWAGRTRKTVPT